MGRAEVLEAGSDECHRQAFHLRLSAKILRAPLAHISVGSHSAFAACATIYALEQFIPLPTKARPAEDGHQGRERNMIDIERSRSLTHAHARAFTKRKLLQLGIASALATGMLGGNV